MHDLYGQNGRRQTEHFGAIYAKIGVTPTHFDSDCADIRVNLAEKSSI
jgi:hypothetical protein